MTLTPAQTGWLIAGIALLMRFIYSATGIHTFPESALYLEAAQAWSQGAFTQFHPSLTPGYILWSTGILQIEKGLFGPAVLAHLQQGLVFFQSLLGILTAVLTSQVALKLFQNRTIGLVCGLWVACSPGLIQLEHSLHPGSLYALMLVLYAWMLQCKSPKADWGLVGVTVALVWLKPLGWLVALLTAGRLWQQKRPQALIMLTLSVGAAGLLWTGVQYQAHQVWTYQSGGFLKQAEKIARFPVYASTQRTPFQERVLAALPANATQQQAQLAVQTAVTHYTQDPRLSAYQRYIQADADAQDWLGQALMQEPVRYIMVTLQSTWECLVAPASPWYWSPLFLLSMLGGVLTVYPQRNLQDPQVWLLLLLWGHWLVMPWFGFPSPEQQAMLEPWVVLYGGYAIDQLIRAPKEPSVPQSFS